MATVELNGITKTYGKKVKALTDLTVSLDDGEFFVLLGPSGAGKTTTLKSVAGLQEIDSGTVTIAGRDMTGVEPYNRNVAMAFESYALYPQKTVAQNLASPLRSGRTGTYSEAQRKQRIDLVTTTLGINHLLERFPRELSNGQRQRVALGRVLVRPADVYLLDEPLSHLDAKLRAAMRAELKHLGDISNVTTFYVTHDYQEALSLGDRVGVLRQGRLVQIGTPEEVWNRPVDSFVAKALGQPEINIFDGVVEQGRIKARGPAPARGRGALAAGVAAGVGLRPRDIEMVDGAPRRRDGGWLVMDGTVRLAERLGRLVELDIHVGDVELIVVSASEHARVEGDRVQVQIPLDLVYVFAAAEPDDDSAWLGSAAPPRQRREAADHSSSTRT